MRERWHELEFIMIFSGLNSSPPPHLPRGVCLFHGAQETGESIRWRLASGSVLCFF